MVKRVFSDYEQASAILIGLATILLGTVFFTNRGDLTSAILALSAIGSFIAAIFILTFSKGDALDPQIASLLSVQGTVTIATLCADLGIQGKGCVIPGVARSGSSQLIHHIPVANYRPFTHISDTAFLMGEGACGVTMVPAGEPLRSLLEHEYGLTIPTSEQDLFSAIKDICSDVLEIADDVTVTKASETVVVDLYNYHLIDGCRTVRAVSPKCCTVYPCPVCSLMACILAQGLGRPVVFENVVVNQKKGNLQLIYAFLP